jgi:diacylglycerol kinase family enzyme
MEYTADLIYNPNAGRFPSRILAERAADVLRENGWKIRLIKTRSGDHVTQLAQRAAEVGKEALFVVGGDGTINLAVRGLVGSETALGVLPGGTGNVLAQGLVYRACPGPGGCARRKCKKIGDSTVRKVDVGLCGDTPQMWAGVGLDALLFPY